MTQFRRPESARIDTSGRRGKRTCLDCGADTCAIKEYYVVTDDVWLAANPDNHGMLCIGCLENRLGRKLRPDDFTDCPLNACKSHRTASPRLLDRLAEHDGAFANKGGH
jgi:hypothetical protein